MPPHVLISGAGIAGTVLAYWLAQHDFAITILERSRSDSQAGQIIDIEGPAREIMRRMGLMEEIVGKVSHEAGIRFVDDAGKEYARFPAGEGGLGVSNEIEIMRPELAGVLMGAVERVGGVKVRYGCGVSGVRQLEKEGKALVDIEDRVSNTMSTEEFDFLVACDGLRSTTRDLVLPVEQRRECLKPTGFFAAFFSIPAKPHDRPYATLLNAPGRRTVFLKPLTDEQTSAYLTCGKASPQLREARASRDFQAQKRVLARHFEGLGWETERVLEGMRGTQNFYFEEITQVKLGRWFEGRCVLLGDTAYCPSPLTGQGTNLAILGAYVLAAKLVKAAKGGEKDPRGAFEAYERDLRPYVDKVQPIPLGGYLPTLINPETRWGIWVLRKIVGWVSWLQLWRIIPDIKNVGYELPEL